MNRPGCIADATLQAYHAGDVSAELMDAVADHVRGCATCLERLDQLSTCHDPLLQALRQEQSPIVVRQDPIVDEVVAKVLARDGAETPDAAPAAALAPGTMLDEYRLIERIGAGGMGAVFRAVHVRLDRDVAVKVIQPRWRQDERMAGRFQSEMKAIGKLRHPNIVAATDAGEAAGVLYLVMELERGSDLAEYVRRHGPLLIAESCDYARQAALGLQAAHEAGLVHRD